MMLVHGIVADGGGQEVGRNQLGALMKQLVESMLAVCAGFPPDDRTCLVGHLLAIPIHRFPIAFHVSLLEVSREAMHVLVVG